MPPFPEVRRVLREWLRPAVVLCCGYDGFISYSRRDAATYARALRARLEEAGLTIYLDTNDLDAGSPLLDTIRRRIRRAPYFIRLDTPEGLRSRYVRAELRYAVASDRQLIRVVFPLIADSPVVWQRLTHPFGRYLDERIWLDEPDLDPRAQEPSESVADQIRRVHITRRKRRRFLTWAAGVLLTLGLSAGVNLVASYAVTQANAAVNTFRDQSVSIARARAAADGLLRARWFPLFDLFAARQHWQLRNLMTATYLKRVGSVPDVRNLDSCSNIGDRTQCIVHGARVRLAETGRYLQVIGSAGAFDITESSEYESVLAGDEAIAYFKGRQLILLRAVPGEPIDFEKIAELPLANAYLAMAFSDDGRYLLVVSQPNQLLGKMLSLIDAERGVALQSLPLSAATLDRGDSPGSSRSCAPGEQSVALAGNDVKVCADGLPFGFEMFREAHANSYALNRESRNNPVIGAAFGPHGMIAYWVQTQKIYVCTPACQSVRAENAVSDIAGPSPIVSLEIAPNATGAPDLFARVQDGRRVRCPGDGSRCELVDTRAQRVRLAVAEGGSTVDLDASGYGVVMSAGGAQVGAPYGELFVQGGARATAAALTPSGSIAVIGLETDRGSLLAVGIRSLLRGMTWYRLEAVGRVLAVTIDAQAQRMTTLEHWNAVIIVRSYPLSPGPVRVVR
jgi:hypothetical protein